MRRFLVTLVIAVSLLTFVVGGAAAQDSDAAACVGEVAKPYGHFVGNVVTLRYVCLTKQPGVELDFSRVPKAGQRYGDFEILSAASGRTGYRDGTYEVRLDFTIQLFVVRDAQEWVEFAIEVFWSDSDSKPKIVPLVPAARIFYSPLSLPTEIAGDEPHGLEPLQYSRRSSIAIAGAIGVTVFLAGLGWLGALLWRLRCLRKASPLALARRALVRHLRVQAEARDEAWTKAGMAMFREALSKKFDLAPSSSPSAVFEAISALPHWVSYAARLRELWRESDLVLFAGISIRDDHLWQELILMLKKLAKSELNEF